MTVDATLRAEGLSALQDGRSTLDYALAANVKAEAARWLREGCIPLGAVTILAGLGGLGKSTYAFDLAARVSTGALPGDLLGKPAGVIVVSAEDSPSHTIRPRLEAAGADLGRVAIVRGTVAEGESDGLRLPDDLQHVTDLAHHIDARLLILDPFVAMIPVEIDAHRDQHVRRVLGPLAALSEALDLTTLGVMHLRKAETADPLARIGGSGGFGNAARSVLMFGAEPNAPDGDAARVLAHLKCNLAPLAPSVAGRIVPATVTTPDGQQIDTSRWEATGESSTTARELLEPDRDPTATDEAADFLHAMLADGPRSAQEIRSAAHAHGVSDRTLRRAKERLGVRAEQVRKGDRIQGWEWTLGAPIPRRQHLGHLGAPSPQGGQGGQGALPSESGHLAPDPDAEIARIQAKFRGAA